MKLSGLFRRALGALCALSLLALCLYAAFYGPSIQLPSLAAALLLPELSEGAPLSQELFSSDGILLSPHLIEEPELPDSEDYGQYLLPTPSVAPSLSLPAGAKKLAALTVKGGSSHLHYKDVYVKNPTSASIDVRQMYESGLSWRFADSGPQILIIHSHGSEAYNTHGGAYWLASDTSRSTDITENVVAVGARLASILHGAGFSVLHSTVMHDQPSYSLSYTNALRSTTYYLSKYPSIRMVIDVHRDALGDENIKYKLISEIDGQSHAQLMLVMGTGISGLSFPNWRQNLSFAVKLQQAVCQRYPTLMRPITMTKHRYNEHTTLASFILEVGSDGNTLQEALRSIELFGTVLAELLHTL